MLSDGAMFSALSIQSSKPFSSSENKTTRLIALRFCIAIIPMYYFSWINRVQLPLHLLLFCVLSLLDASGERKLNTPLTACCLY